MYKLSPRSDQFEFYFVTEQMRVMGRFHLSTQQEDVHNNGYTFSLPNISTYDINTSVQVGSEGDLKQCALSIFPPKKEVEN